MMDRRKLLKLGAFGSLITLNKNLLFANNSERDIDKIPIGEAKVISTWNHGQAANAALFDASQTKMAFRCDAYFVDANTPLRSVITQVTYWHGLFGHRRTSHMWKGILRLPLVSDDADALKYLDRVWP